MILFFPLHSNFFHCYPIIVSTQHEDQLASEMWKDTLTMHDTDQDHTHKDFFDALVQNVEGECQGINPVEKQQSVDEKSVDELGMDERICECALVVYLLS